MSGEQPLLWVVNYILMLLDSGSDIATVCDCSYSEVLLLWTKQVAYGGRVLCFEGRCMCCWWIISCTAWKIPISQCRSTDMPGKYSPPGHLQACR